VDPLPESHEEKRRFSPLPGRERGEVGATETDGKKNEGGWGTGGEK